MKNRFFLGIVLFLLISSLFASFAAAESTRLKIITYLDPNYVLGQIKAQPSILYFTVGRLYYNAGNLDKAKKMFEKSAKLTPDFAPAYHNLGVVYYKQGDYDSTIQQFEKAIEADSDYSKAYYSLGILYFEIGDFDNSIVNLLEVVGIEQDNANANFDLGQSYVAKFRKAEEKNEENYSDLEDALVYLKRAEDIKPGFPNAENNIKIIESIIDARDALIQDLQ